MQPLKQLIHRLLARVSAHHVMRMGVAFIVASLLVLLLETAALAQAAPASPSPTAEVLSPYALNGIPHTLGVVGVLFVAVGWFAKRDHQREKEFAAYRERVEERLLTWGEQHREDAQRWEGRYRDLAKDTST